MPKKPTSKSKKSDKISGAERLARQREKPKSFERYEKTQPVQLALFEMLEPENRQYSIRSRFMTFYRRIFGKSSPGC